VAAAPLPIGRELRASVLLGRVLSRVLRLHILRLRVLRLRVLGCVLWSRLLLWRVLWRRVLLGRVLRRRVLLGRVLAAMLHVVLVLVLSFLLAASVLIRRVILLLLNRNALALHAFLAVAAAVPVVLACASGVARTSSLVARSAEVSAGICVAHAHEIACRAARLAGRALIRALGRAAAVGVAGTFGTPGLADAIAHAVAHALRTVAGRRACASGVARHAACLTVAPAVGYVTQA